MFGKAFQRDASRLLILAVLADGPSYGYAITKDVAARSDNGLKLSPGVLYPLLARLEREGMITSTWEVIRSDRRGAEEGGEEGEGAAEGAEATGGRRRKWYRLSAKGRRHLASGAKGYRTHLSMLRSLLPATGEEGQA